MALIDGASMLNPTTKRLTSQISSEFQFIKPISGQFGSTLYGVVLGEAGWVGAVQLVRLPGEDGRVPLPRTFGPAVCLTRSMGVLEQSRDHLLLLKQGSAHEDSGSLILVPEVKVKVGMKQPEHAIQ
jgi:hypothetical protein